MQSHLKRATPALIQVMILQIGLGTAHTECTHPTVAAWPSVLWPPTQGRGRVSLIVSRDLDAEPRISVGPSFTNAGAIWSVAVDGAAGRVDFPAPGQASFPLSDLADFPAGPVSIQAVFTPYELYNRSDGYVGRTRLRAVLYLLPNLPGGDMARARIPADTNTTQLRDGLLPPYADQRPMQEAIAMLTWPNAAGGA